MGVVAHPANNAAVLEKDVNIFNISSDFGYSTGSTTATLPLPVTSRFARWNTKLENLAGLEARGITRVLPEERHAETLMGYLQMALLWFSANISVNNLAVGFLGPLVYNLGFVDCALCAVFGVLLGSMSTAYMSTWGAASGNRTMVVARYFMGHWPSKLACILNIILMVGYSTIDCIIGGQILSAVSGGSMSIVVGITVVALVSWVVAVFGMAVFHVYERWAWLPQVLVLFVLVGSAGPSFNAALQSVGDSNTINGNRLSFLSLCLYVPNSWAGASSDYYVYYPETSSKLKIFFLTFSGLTLSFWFVDLLGIGLASGIATNPAWSQAYEISSGALVVAGYNGLGGFGRFCGVIVALGVIANSTPSTYSAALGFQVLGRYPKAIPRYLWATVCAIIYFVCAVAGRDSLFIIFQNFLALMGYWLMIFICIALEEHLVFRRGVGFDWTAWASPERLPIGIAALISFLLGWMGAILGMYQVWYTGPLAKLVGPGADLGMWVGCGFALIVFPPLRYLEMRRYGR